MKRNGWENAVQVRIATWPFSSVKHIFQMDKHAVPEVPTAVAAAAPRAET